MSQAVIGSLRVNLGLDSAQFAQGLQNAQSRMADFGRRMQVVGAAVSAVGAGVALAVRGQLNAADQLAKMSGRIGIPVEALSQLQFAAELSGVSLEKLEIGLRGLSRNMVDSEGSFVAMGIAMRDAEGNLRATEDVLLDFADVLAEMPDGAEKTALAMALMGRSGADLLPLLNGGSAALRGMMQEADALGLTLSGDAAKAAEQFNDNITRLQRTVTGLWRQMSAQLAPVLAQISDALVAAAGVFRDLSPEAQRFLGVAGGLTIALGPLLVAAGLLVTAMAALSAPVLAAVAAITAITAAVVAFWPHLVEMKDNGLAAIGDLVDGFWAMKESIEASIANVVTVFQGVFNELLEWLRQLPAQMVQIGRDLIQGLADGILERWENVKSRVTGVFTGITDSVRDLFAIRSPSKVFAEIGGQLMEGLLGGIETGSFKVKEFLEQFARDAAATLFRSGISQIFGAAFPGIDFGGFRAMGGPVTAGRSYVVGERGPEMFVPATSGKIVPNAGGGSIVINIDARGSVEGEAERFASFIPEIERRVIGGVQDRMARGRM